MTRSAVAAAALALAFAACARNGGEPAAPHVLRIADNVDPSSLNPLLAHDQDTIGYDLLVTQTLVGLSADNRLVPVLITRVPSQSNGDISRDGRTIVYRLRHGVRFADGAELTSTDVAFTFRAILDSRNPVESQDAYRRVEALQTPNRYTVVVRLKRRWNAAVAELFAQADFAFGILPAHAFPSTDVTRAAWNALPFGTGPFKVVEWERASRIVLEPNPYYRPRPRLHRIVLAMIPTRQAALLALQTRAIDVAEIDARLVRQARSVAEARVVTTPINGLEMLLLQSAAPPTGDLHVRRAIAAAIDRGELTRPLLGTVTPADSFLPPVLAWHDPDPHGAVADSSAAARELSDDGWRKSGEFWTKAGKRLSITIVFPAVMPPPVLEQEQLRRAGIEASIKPYTAVLFNAPGGPLRSGNFTIAETEWIGGADPEQSVIFACSQRGSDGNNSMNYCSSTFDARFEDQATTSDPSRRRRDFIEMQRIVRRDVPTVPLYFESEIDVVRDRVIGFRRNMLMYPVNAEEWDTR